MKLPRRRFTTGLATLGGAWLLAPKHARAEAPPLTFVAGGDVVFTRDLNAALHEQPILEPLSGVQRWFRAADVAFVNLESPLASDTLPRRAHRERAPILRGDPAAAQALARGGVDVVSVANNHVFDLGEAGLAATLEHVERAGMTPAGAGLTRERALEPAILEVRGRRFGLLAFTYGTNHRPERSGPHAARLGEAAERLRQVRGQVDTLVVSLHFGEEFTSTVSLDQRVWAHRCVDAGADAVIGHHPHVLQGVEVYAGKPIYYSLGNFIWGLASVSALSAMAYVEFGGDGRQVLSAKVLPVLRGRGHALPRVVDAKRGRYALAAIRGSSYALKTKLRATEEALELVLG